MASICWVYALLATLLYYLLLFSYCVYFVMENKLSLSLSLSSRNVLTQAATRSCLYDVIDKRYIKDFCRVHVAVFYLDLDLERKP